MISRSTLVLRKSGEMKNCANMSRALWKWDLWTSKKKVVWNNQQIYSLKPFFFVRWRVGGGWEEGHMADWDLYMNTYTVPWFGSLVYWIFLISLFFPCCKNKSQFLLHKVIQNPVDWLLFSSFINNHMHKNINQCNKSKINIWWN